MNTIKTIISVVTLVTSLILAVDQLRKAIDVLREKKAKEEESGSYRRSDAVA